MKDALIVSALSLLPRNRGARAMGWFARTAASRWFTRLFVWAYGVDLTEAEGSLADYPTLEALFTRRLRPGVRPIDPRPGAMVSPVDGTCAYAGPAQAGQIEVAPGRSLSLSALLGREVHGEPEVAVLYLSPTDYHRVHVPCDGEGVGWRYVPGTLWPVFPAAVRRIDGLFARNERVVVQLATEAGPVDVVLVGAFGVGRIGLQGLDLLTNTGGAAGEGPYDRSMTRGDELGVFHLGSTVVLVTEAGRWRWAVAAGDVVRMGAFIGEVVPGPGSG